MSFNPLCVTYTEFAELTVQNDSQAGKSSRCSAKVVLLGEFDNVESLVGQKVRITGYYIAYNITVYGCTSVDVGTTFLANHLEPYNAVDRPLVCDVLQNIRQLNNARIFDRIVASIAPTIKGFDRVKRALVLSLFSGVPKTVAGRMHLRGDIHLMLCGDPAIGKTHLLKAAQKLAPRAIYTTGQGSTASGLTATVYREKGRRHWSLSAGAMVIANNGVCIIDDLQLLKDTDRSALLEQMEHQTISIAKAGIVTTLKSDCTVLAACSPINNIYDRTKPLSYNVPFKTPLLSRFDVHCVMSSSDELILEAAVSVLAQHVAQWSGLQI
ncbi:dna replication licensing factor mcm family member [Holotrichia oblita]|uniref:Dna replication licensing factor mcm family member n=1 Tax=Holotrichia oblita TaxID=644536 RepID=A0ACB9SKK4_HOLOL|nr:dna replication licensing factor mcm family member [Holotrichia oblita]